MEERKNIYFSFFPERKNTGFFFRKKSTYKVSNTYVRYVRVPFKKRGLKLAPFLKRGLPRTKLFSQKERKCRILIEIINY